MFSSKLFNSFFCKHHTWEMHSIVTDRACGTRKAQMAYLVSIWFPISPDLDWEPFMLQTLRPANWELVWCRLLGRNRRGHHAAGDGLRDSAVYCCHNNITQQVWSWEGQAGTWNSRVHHISTCWCLPYPEHPWFSCLFSATFPTVYLGGTTVSTHGDSHRWLPPSLPSWDLVQVIHSPNSPMSIHSQQPDRAQKPALPYHSVPRSCFL